MQTKRAKIAAVVCLAAVALGGCERDEIRRYQVPRVESVAVAAPPKADAPTRLLGAILPQGETAWFFKLAGPPEAVANQKKAFDAFIHSVRLTGEAERPITWTVPEGWHEHPGAETRYATFHVGSHEEEPLEVTVSRAGGSILDNVNRWRGQIGLSPVSEAELGKATEETEVGGVRVTLVEMTGPGGTGGRMAPFAMGQSPLDSPRPSGNAGRPSIAYEAPEGWKEQRHPLGMPLPAFKVGEAEVTVTLLAGSAGGLAANVNRWRQQVGLAPLGEEQLQKDMRPIAIGGASGHHVDLAGPAAGGGPGQRILGGIVTRGGDSWFFKMRGPADLLEEQKHAFDAFLRSVRFETGANNEGRP